MVISLLITVKVYHMIFNWEGDSLLFYMFKLKKLVAKKTVLFMAIL